MCCTRLAENTGRKKIAKNSPSAHHRTILSGCIFATKACIDNRRTLLNSNISSRRPHNMANVGTRMAEICLPVWGTPANFNQFRVCFVTAAMSLTGGQPNFARFLVISWAGTLYIHWGGENLPPDIILSRAKFTLRPSLAFSYIGVTAWHSSSGPQPNFAAWYKEWNYGTFAEGATYIRLHERPSHGHRPTFVFKTFFVHRFFDVAKPIFAKLCHTTRYVLE